MRRLHRPQPSLLWWWLVPLLLAVFAAGARGLNADPIWSDEYYSIFNGGIGPLGPLTVQGIWERIATIDPWHTPGFFMLLNGWSQLVGWEPFVLRALSLLFGVLALAWTYRLGRFAISRQAGLYGAVIVGTSLFFIHYTHEIRMYTLIVMLTAFTTWAYLRLLRLSRPRPLDWLALFGGAAALLYTHYFAALPLAAVGMYHLLFARKDRRWLQIAGVFVLAGLMFAAWLPGFFAGLALARSAENLQRGALSSTQALLTIAGLFSNGAFVLLVGGLLLATYAARRSSGVRYVAAIALLLAGVIAAVNAVMHIIEDTRLRYLISLWPLLALLLGAGIASLRRWRYLPLTALAAWSVAALLGGTIPAYIAQLDSASYIFPIHDEAPVLRSAVQPGDYVLNYLPPGLPEGRYDKLMDFYLYGITPHYRLLEVRGDAGEQRAIHGEVVTSLAQTERLWLGYMPSNPPPNLYDLTSRMDESFDLCYAPIDTPALNLSLYARAQVCCIPDGQPAAPVMHFGGIELVGYETLLSHDGMLSVVLAWRQDDDVPPHRYSAALHLFDTNGNRVAQADYGFEPGANWCRRALLDVSALASGSYDLHIGVYAWETGEHLSGVALGTGAEAQMLPLTTVALP